MPRMSGRPAARTSRGEIGGTLDLLIVTNDSYSSGAESLLRSVALCATEPVHTFVVDVGLRPVSRRALADAGLSLTWLRPTDDQVELLQSFHCDGEHGHWAVYARLLLGELLPPETTRVTYLDADALCLRDPTALARRDLEGDVLGAVQDRWVSGLHVRRVLGKDRSRPLGVPAYFNSGVLEIDVEAWRREKVWEDLLELLNEGRRYAFYDQDPLNVVLAGRWHELEPAWNQLVGPAGHSPSSASLAAVEGGPVTHSVAEAAVVHFVGSGKPWSTAPDVFPEQVGALVRRHYPAAPARPDQ